jgi:hypothetical protein
VDPDLSAAHDLPTRAATDSDETRVRLTPNGHSRVAGDRRLATSPGSIYVLHGGRLVEQGTHDELIAHGGQNAELFMLQASGYADAYPAGLGSRPA